MMSEKKPQELIQRAREVDPIPVERAENIASDVLDSLEHVDKKGVIEVVREAYKRAYRLGLLEGGIPLGTKVICPTCGTPGRFNPDLPDMGGEPVFKDSVWLCRTDGVFVCTTCWNEPGWGNCPPLPY